MHAVENVSDAFNRACTRERQLWLLVRGQVPGDPGYSKDLWKEWLHSAGRVRVLAAEQARMVALPKTERSVPADNTRPLAHPWRDVG